MSVKADEFDFYLITKDLVREHSSDIEIFIGGSWSRYYLGVDHAILISTDRAAKILRTHSRLAGLMITEVEAHKKLFEEIATASD